MKVTIDPTSGFCFGVVYAIQMAEDELLESGELYCLGDIVHNDKEVERLTKMGLKIIDHDDLQKLHDCKVLIRAHGEPPETYELALNNNIELIDASCPVVLKLQNRVKTAFDKTKKGLNGQIVIYGKPGHAEVNGLIGQTNKEAIIITTVDDLDKIDFTRPITMFSQTTKSTASFYNLKEIIETRAQEVGNDEVTVNDTICRQVSNRDIELRKFALEHDVIVFVSGKKSSNGKVLYNVCKTMNERSYFVTDEQDISKDWFADTTSVGICGATSPPMWLMETVASQIKTF